MGPSLQMSVMGPSINHAQILVNIPGVSKDTEYDKSYHPKGILLQGVKGGLSLICAQTEM